ncbi:hypothetical protein CPB84DRAFT_1785265 [Gymnopilus junonius]|uniref:Secreted protein n=1 Tax=Gymnopilus junonius TaxID=109634 RepID=A0A9P5TJU5_GYMJU|nr:hypothetical protein CPB84DRAFT_1785265 [Gymnopilus junonius]
MMTRMSVSSNIATFLACLGFHLTVKRNPVVTFGSRRALSECRCLILVLDHCNSCHAFCYELGLPNNLELYTRLWNTL